jgi:hypothetical protein
MLRELYDITHPRALVKCNGNDGRATHLLAALVTENRIESRHLVLHVERRHAGAGLSPAIHPIFNLWHTLPLTV